jgi:uncharacterized iron-regulated membrane protein
VVAGLAAAAWTPRLRRAFIWLHRWIGLIAGALLVLIGLTGSFNVFYREIDAALNLTLYEPLGPERNVTAAEAMRAAATVDPAPITSIIFPDRTWPVWIAIHAHGKGGHAKLWTAMVDPSNGRVLGRRDYTNSFAFTIYRLHSALLVHDWWGKELVGVLGIGLLLSALSGLYLWWPRPGRIWRSMSIRKGVSPQRFIIDLHNAAGSWTLPALILIAVTGIGIVFPNGVRPIIGLFSVATPYPSPKVTPPAKGAPMLSADQIVEFARAAKPGLDIALLNPPVEARNTWRVLFHPPRADPALRSRGAIWLDPWTGVLVHDRTPDVMSPGDSYVTEQLWLHNGATLGFIGRVLVFAAGFAPLALFVSGFWAWRNKRLARRALLLRPAPSSRTDVTLVDGGFDEKNDFKGPLEHREASQGG